MVNERERFNPHRFVSVLDPAQAVIRECYKTIPLFVLDDPNSYGAVAYNWDDPVAEQYRVNILTTVKGMDRKSVLQMSTDERREWFYAVSGDIGSFADYRCRFTLRMTVDEAWQKELFAADLISFGVGVLRPKYAVGFEAAIKSIEGANFNRAKADLIISPNQSSDVVIGQTQWGGDENGYMAQAWESTNLVFGDALGELEQLGDRRDEVDLMSAVVEELQRLSNPFDDDGTRSNFDVFANRTATNFIPVYKAHFDRHKIWDNPPASAEELLKRVDFLLEAILIEEKSGV